METTTTAVGRWAALQEIDVVLQSDVEQRFNPACAEVEQQADKLRELLETLDDKLGELRQQVCLLRCAVIGWGFGWIGWLVGWFVGLLVGRTRVVCACVARHWSVRQSMDDLSRSLCLTLSVSPSLSLSLPLFLCLSLSVSLPPPSLCLSLVRYKSSTTSWPTWLRPRC